VVTPSAKRQAVQFMASEHRVPVQRACAWTGLSRAAYYRKPIDGLQRDEDVIVTLNGVVERHGRWGFCKCYQRLRLDGRSWNHKRVWRVYCEMRLNNRTYRNEVLDAYLFKSIEQVQHITEEWLLDYNERRPHDALGGLPPRQFLPRITTAADSNSGMST
jgi:putative transposase